jgi:hypothetical protein
MHDYLIQLAPSPQALVAAAAVILTCAVAAMPKPTSSTGGYYWFYNFAQSLPIPTFAHLKN